MEHPIYEAADGDIYGANYTYLDAGSGVPDLDLRWSILSQAALAAPLLLWPPQSPSSEAAGAEAAGAGGETGLLSFAPFI